MLIGHRDVRHRARGLSPVRRLTYFLPVFVGVLSQKQG
jgi:hypothetical protein